MRRGILSAVLVVVVLSLPVFWLFRPPAALPARFAAADCERVALKDTDTGEPIVGVEDMAPVPGSDRLILSAMDRRAYRRSPRRAPEGGLYEVSLDRLAAGAPWAEPLVARGSVAGGLFPHGIAVSDDGARLAAVNRSRGGETAIIGGRLSRGVFSPRRERRGAALCRANDLDFAGDGRFGLRVTLDRGHCGVAWADLRPGATTGRVIALDLAGADPPRVEARGLSFANGIAGLWIAETRAARLHNLLDRPVTLPGGPDNLTWGPEGELVVALHPSTVQIAAYLHGLSGAAPTRIVRVTSDRRVEVLFDDPSGDLFSGATAAVLRGGVLVAGSAVDAGVLVCRQGGA